MPATTTAREIMTAEVSTFGPDVPLLDAARTLFDNRWAGAPVLEHGKIVGVLSLADVIAQERSVHAPTPIIVFDALLYLGTRRFEKEMKKITAMTVRNAMTSPAKTVSPTTKVSEIAAMMIDDGLSTVPVVEDGELVGLVGRRDVVRLVLGRDRADSEQ
ncbi:MAG: CBS domain-containing protein [Proteobacteria bacterium]|nr:CBS domain-containing protein [Pseudomonadota bacterium]